MTASQWYMPKCLISKRFITAKILPEDWTFERALHFNSKDIYKFQVKTFEVVLNIDVPHKT
jgi:hypothetical protein